MKSSNIALLLACAIAGCVVFALPCAASAVPTVSPSLIASDHVSEGVLLDLGPGRLLHVFRLDPGVSGNHIGNRGCIAFRKSVDGGADWSTVERIDPSPWDDRNIAAFVRGGEVQVEYRQYDAVHKTGFTLNSLETFSSGWAWRNTVLHLPLVAPGRTVIAPDGICEVPGVGWLALMHDSSTWNQYLVTSADGVSWDFAVARQLPIPDGMSLGEGALAHLGDQRVIAVFRHESYSIPGYHVMFSADAGETWTEPQLLSDHMRWSSAPHLLSVPESETVYLVGGERVSPYTDEANHGCAVVLYRSTNARLSANPLDWDFYGAVPRPWPSSMPLYGYPSAAPRGDGTHLVVFTDRKRDSDGTEGAGLFQFVLEEAEGNPRAPSLTATIPATVNAKSPFKVTGRVVAADGGPVVGLDCYLQRRYSGQSWVTVRSVTTTADGTWSTICTTSAKAQWRAVTATATGGHVAGYGPVTVMPVLRFTMAYVPRTASTDSVVKATGTAGPVKTRGPVYLSAQRRTSSGWRTVRRPRAKVTYVGGGRSRLSASVRLPSKGSWRLCFVTASNAYLGRSASAFRYVTVR